jgi:hypothetical protein
MFFDGDQADIYLAAGSQATVDHCARFPELVLASAWDGGACLMRFTVGRRSSTTQNRTFRAYEPLPKFGHSFIRAKPP